MLTNADRMVRPIKSVEYRVSAGMRRRRILPKNLLQSTGTQSVFDRPRSFKNYLKTRASNRNPSLQHPSRPGYPPADRHRRNTEHDVIWKVIWTLSVLICSSICVYQIQERILYFFEKPINANVQLIRNTTVMFPAFTLCPPFMFRYTNLYALFMENGLDPKTNHVTGLIQKHIMNVTDFYEWASFHTINSKKGIRGKIVDLLAYLALTGSIVQSSIITPSMRNVSTYIGKCLTLSFEKPVLYQGQGTVFKVLSGHGVNITRTVLRCNHLDLNIIYAIYVHPNTTNPVHVAPASGLKVLRGHTTSISLGVKEYRFLNRSTFICVTQHENDMCVGDCVAVNILPHVSCRMPLDFPQLNHLPVCDNPKSFMWFYNVAQNAYGNQTSMAACTTKCPRACLETVYVQNIQYLVKTDNVVAPDFTEVAFYFADNVFERVEEVLAYGAINLLCDMGGSLGLFLGFSLLTMLDIIRNITRVLHSVHAK